MPTPLQPEPSLDLGRTFLAQLIGDIIDCRQRLAAEDSDAGRRHLVRTVFAAIEGVVWTCREHVLAIASSMGTLQPLAGMALREQTYMVSERGDVVEQIRFVTLPAMLRLIAKQAQLIEPELTVRFDNSGWQNLKEAIVIRNRITHPKLVTDLAISDADVTIVNSGFTWTLATTEYIMASANLAHRWRNEDLRTLLGRLESGDPAALAAYQVALAAAHEAD